ncbi:sensor histidine kinase [Rothia dentocariosa]|uniref:sensor histidine kinase n=1 Tax=Rothia dentocariosa TaxID=2047 RepID=UPI00195CFEAE|nr:histidine kinase [Rothia dentocariosa]VTY12425.1 Sensor histidine kinase DesK [Rothia dentocariosa]
MTTTRTPHVSQHDAGTPGSGSRRIRRNNTDTPFFDKSGIVRGLVWGSCLNISASGFILIAISDTGEAELVKNNLILCTLLYQICMVLFFTANTMPQLIPVKNTVLRTALWCVLVTVPIGYIIVLYPQGIAGMLYTISPLWVALWLMNLHVPFKLGVKTAVAIAVVFTTNYFVGVVGQGYFDDSLTTPFPVVSGDKTLNGFFIFDIVTTFHIIAYFVGRSMHKSREHMAIEKELDILSERERIARDVHDVLGHSLTIVNLKAELAAKLVETNAPAAQEQMRQVAQLSRQALAEVHSTVTRLRIPDLEGEVLASSRALETAGIQASLPDATTAANVAGMNSSLFSWALRETVTNIVRHSHATYATVRLNSTGLEVIDNGVGIGDAPCKSGLTGLRTRIEDAGGILTLGNAPEHWLQQTPVAGVGDGCRIRISMDEKTDEIMG